MYKVVIESTYLDSTIEQEIFEKHGINLVICTGKDRESILKEAENADGLLQQYMCIDEQFIKQLKKCKIIVHYGVGVDSIDIKAATRQNIQVANVPDYGVYDVSNHALMFLLMLSKKVTLLNNLVKESIWDSNSAYPLFRLKNKTLGLLGFGTISREVARKAKVLGLNIIGHDKYLGDNVFEEYKVKKVEFEELLKNSDYLSIHIPLNKETNNLIGEIELKKMKKGSYIINTSRGGIICENSLCNCLEDGWIAGAAVDVLADETTKLNNRLIKNNNVIITPHCAWYSEEALCDLKNMAAMEIIRVLVDKKIATNIVNKDLVFQSKN